MKRILDASSKETAIKKQKIDNNIINITTTTDASYYITLTTSDDKVIIIDRFIAEQIPSIREMINYMGNRTSNTSISFYNITSQIFTIIVYDLQGSVPLKLAFESLDLETFRELKNATLFLGCDSMVELCDNAISQHERVPKYEAKNYAPHTQPVIDEFEMFTGIGCDASDDDID